MADTVYDASTAADYRAAREIPREGLTAWREAIAEHAAPSPGATVLDVGAGTGAFATALRDWFGVHVVAVEPAPAMRELIPVGRGSRSWTAGPSSCRSRTRGRTPPGSARWSTTSAISPPPHGSCTVCCAPAGRC